MPIGGKGLKEQFLDLDFCFAVWCMTGSTPKMEVWFIENEFLNPETGKPFSRQGLYSAAKRSDKFAEFKRRREDGEILLQVATLDEIEECKIYVEQNKEKEITRNKEDFERYAAYRTE